MRDIATATLSGNLTRDVQLARAALCTEVARLRVATTTRRWGGEEWVEKTNYFTLEVYGAQARAARSTCQGVAHLRGRGARLARVEVTFESGRARTDTSEDSSEHNGLIPSSQAAAPVDGVTAGDVSAGAEDLPF